MDTFQTSSLLDRQRELEDHSLGEGAIRFRQRLNEAVKSGRGGEVGAARKLLYEGLDPLTKGLEELLEAARGRGAEHVAMPWIRKLGAEITAYFTLRTCLGALAGGDANLRFVAKQITMSMLDELRYRRFKAEAPGLFVYRMKLLDTANYSHARKAIDATMRFANIDISDLDISDRDRLLIGSKLIDTFIECTKLATVDSNRSVKGKKYSTALTLKAEPDAREWINSKNSKLELLFPVHLPMLVEPLPWLPSSPGGYAFALRAKHQMLRTNRPTANEKADLPVLRTALNTIQNTGWRINLPVMGLVATLADRGMIAGEEQAEIPPKPEDIDTNVEARRIWRKTVARLKNANHTSGQKALATARMLEVAGQFANDTFYFPYNLDFRGRVYPLPNFLSPHGDDKQKAILLFNEKVVLGHEGVRYLALHGAACLDETPAGLKLTTLSLDERVEWITKNTPKLAKVAAAPLENLWWLDADQPFSFYAFCLEWTRIHNVTGKKPHECKSALPVGQDGSCNGVQHFSALLRDAIGGLAVNLVPSPRPNDLYQRVADGSLARLEQLASAPEGRSPEECGSSRLASLWLSSGVVGRKFCKRPAMTFGYGSQEFGFANQIIEYMRGLDNWPQLVEHFSVTDEKGKTKSIITPAAAFMATVIWDVLRERVVAAFQAMEWMRRCTRKLTDKNIPVEWTVPGTGLAVQQTYCKEKTKQISTVIGGKIRKPAYYERTAKVNAEKQANAISPNFIHSLDAAVMMHTVLHATDAGITHFALVHDSFATHAGRMAEFSRVIRESFVRFYEQHDPIAALAGEFASRLPEGDREKLPEPPSKGTLEICDVLDSLYFFQ